MHTRSTAFLALVCVVLMTACGVIPGSPEPGPEEWIPSVSPTVTPLDAPEGLYGFTLGEEAAVRVRNSGCESLGTGSGFAIDEHTIITNRHVIENYEFLELTTSDGRELTVESASASTIADIGIITTVETLGSTVPLADEDPNFRDEVTLVGFPLGEELTITIGNVLDRIADDLDNADHVFVVSAEAEHGSSGSAAYNSDGEVFGVLYAGEDDTNWGYIIPVSIVREAMANATPIGPSCDY